MADVHHVAEDGGARVDDAGVDSGSGRPGQRGSGRGTAQTLPLNSRRLTTQILRQLAEGLGVPSRASQGDLQAMIEGKLTEAGRDPLRTQIVLRTVERGAHMTLQDEAGAFMEIEPPEPEDPPEDDPPTEDDDGESEDVGELRAEVERLRVELEARKNRVRELWKLNCEQLAEMDSSLLQKDEVISRLKAEVARLRGTSPSVPSSTSEDPDPGDEDMVLRVDHPRVRRGKAPPVDAFTGEGAECRLDDWLPTLKRAADWNGWTLDDLLIQLAGHLKGRALQEWNLLSAAEKETYERATAALRDRLDPVSKIMAGQDFRHAAQEKNERVRDFIRRLEQLFKIAYGHDVMSTETRDTLLYGQLQEGLRYQLMEAPAVSGAPDYQALCLAAKAEEKRLAELKKRRQYRRDPQQSPPPSSPPVQWEPKTKTNQSSSGWQATKRNSGRCWNCDKPGHVAAECRAPKTGSLSKPRGSGNQGSPHTNQVQTSRERTETEISPGSPTHPMLTPRERGEETEVPPGSTTTTQPGGDATQTADPLQYLLPDLEEEGVANVTEVRVMDQGSTPQLARVEVAGVPLDGVVDTGADITLIGAEAFKRIAAVAKLHRRDFKKSDKIPRTYDQKTFHIDGRVDLDITFQGCTMTTPVYVKMDAKEQLLLSEGVCRQLGIVSYHPQVSPGRGAAESPAGIGAGGDGAGGEVYVPTVRVRLVQTVKLQPSGNAVVDVRLVGDGVGGLSLPKDLCSSRVCDVLPLMLLESNQQLQTGTGVQISSSLVQPSADGLARVLLTNLNALTHRIEEGTEVGHATPVEVVEPETCVASVASAEQAYVGTVTSDGTDDQSRRRELVSLVDHDLSSIPEQERAQLVSLLGRYHGVFSLMDGERGETDLTELHINTGEATPRRQPLRRVPHAVRLEVAKQLRQMQESGVIQPSNSPWASAIVLVRKKNGSIRICVDYRHLNSVTKPDAYPLPRIDDLLDQLGSAKYFTTLDLAAGYWQIRVAKDSIEKTAFATPQGLFEFRVMPFGLTNAPAIFQRLMSRVLGGLNPPEGPDFVAIYIDDVLIFSRSLEEHLQHIEQVLSRVQSAGLKLQPVKCHFICKQVEYLGHLITPHGLQPNPGRVRAVTDFPAPTSVTQVRQFVGLTSYYRRFIEKFAKIAAPLHNLTKKEMEFHWTKDCQEAFDSLKKRLVEAPVLAYPNFDLNFVLETDASYQGLGAVLSQRLPDQKLHPVAFGSRALSPSEKNYSVTEFETLAVVWAIKHFHAYLYGHNVQVVTDHSAVKALLGAPSPSGKHARWWLQVFGSGLRKVDIQYRPGKENVRADALSRNPVGGELTSLHEGWDAQVAAVSSTEKSVAELLETPSPEGVPSDFYIQQQKDPDLRKLQLCLESGILPSDEREARTVATQALNFVIVDNVLYFVENKRGGGSRRRAAVPGHLQRQILEDNHGGRNAGHFSGPRLYAALRRKWWWPNMYKHAVEFCRSCGECATVVGVGRRNKPPLHPIPVQRPFQIVGLDIMELPRTEQGNRYVVVFQDFMTKWPLVFPVPDQKASRLARLVAEELLPQFGVPDAILSDRGANLLAHVMEDVCQLLGVTKLNTTSYHPQCDGMVERLNRSLKSMLRKHVAKFGGQWDRFLPGVLWAYRNTPHESTKEKPSFLLFGIDLRSPTEAALLPSDPVIPCDLSDYREELMLSLASARELAVVSIREAQDRYKGQYDKRARVTNYRVGDWVFVRFPADESGKNRKMSRPWHGPFRVIERKDPNLTLGNVYFPEESTMLVHQLRVCPCPDLLPAGFYWYGSRRRSPGRVPGWVSRFLKSSSDSSGEQTEEHAQLDHGSDEEVTLNDGIDVIHGFSGIDDANMIQDESQSSPVQDESHSTQSPVATGGSEDQDERMLTHVVQSPIPTVAPSSSRYTL